MVECEEEVAKLSGIALFTEKNLAATGESLCVGVSIDIEAAGRRN